MDNLNTHGGVSLYKAFPPHVARSLLDKLECVYTPKHGGWLNLAECKFRVLVRTAMLAGDYRISRRSFPKSRHGRRPGTNPINPSIGALPRKTHGSNLNAFILYYQVDGLLESPSFVTPHGLSPARLVEVDESSCGAEGGNDRLRKTGTAGKGLHGDRPGCLQEAATVRDSGLGSPHSIIHSDGWRGSMGRWIWVIRSISASISNEFARGNCHINGIESFWS